MKKLFLLFHFTFCIVHFSQAQDSCNLRIGLLTCSPGAELYSIFGHTAIRVQNSATGIDEVYNYGTFEFAPDFYSKFIMGKLLYALAVENFNDFTYQYQLESRTVVEQVLQLNCAEKQKLYAALQTNALEQNRFYQYDFLLDNCTTRARDMVERNSFVGVVYKNILPEKIPSFRNLIHGCLHRGNQYWSKLGIDLLLGARIDIKVTNREAMFLPDNLLQGFDSASVAGAPLVTPQQTIIIMPSPLNKSSLFTPAVVLTFLCALIFALSLFKTKTTQTTLSTTDFLLFLATGIIGLLLLFMWFGTDHYWCANNYNLLWALPTNVVAAFFINKKNSKAKLYFKIIFWLMIIVSLAWFFLPQQMNTAFLPITLLLTWRSFHLSKK
ncbi:MAG: DUF4105 domain-containing protein [Bacteroidota bacterium]